MNKVILSIVVASLILPVCAKTTDRNKVVEYSEGGKRIGYYKQMSDRLNHYDESGKRDGYYKESSNGYTVQYNESGKRVGKFK